MSHHPHAPPVPKNLGHVEKLKRALHARVPTTPTARGPTASTAAECPLCASKFGAIRNRPRNCRNCGNQFCTACCNYESTVDFSSVKVCKTCFLKLGGKKSELFEDDSDDDLDDHISTTTIFQEDEGEDEDYYGTTVQQAELSEVASLNELIESLFKSDRPVRLRSTFFLHHKGFVGTAELLLLLRQKFHANDSVYASSLDVLAEEIARKISMINLVLEWSGMHFDDLQKYVELCEGDKQKFDERLSKLEAENSLDPDTGYAWKIAPFLCELAAPVGMFMYLGKEDGRSVFNPDMALLYEQLTAARKVFAMTVSEQFQSSLLDPPIYISPYLRTFDHADMSNNNISLYTAKQIAHQFTIVDMQLYQQIKPRELTRKAWTRKDPFSAPNVTRMVETFNRRTFWACSVILNWESQAERLHALKKIVNTAYACWVLRNFFGAYSLLNGVSLTPIARLATLWGLLPSKSRKRHNILLDKLNTAKNYAAYRESFKAGLLCEPQVPHLAVILNDLYNLEMVNTWTKRKVRFAAHNSPSPHLLSTPSLTSSLPPLDDAGIPPPLPLEQPPMDDFDEIEQANDQQRNSGEQNGRTSDSSNSSSFEDTTTHLRQLSDEFDSVGLGRLRSVVADPHSSRSWALPTNKTTRSLNKDSLATIIDPTHIVMSGFLKKKSQKNRHVWNPRYAVIRGAEMAYFRTQREALNNQNPAAIIPFSYISTVSVPQSGKGADQGIRFNLTLTTARATLEWQAPTKELCRKWVAALRGIQHGPTKPLRSHKKTGTMESISEAELKTEVEVEDPNAETEEVINFHKYVKETKLIELLVSHQRIEFVDLKWESKVWDAILAEHICSLTEEECWARSYKYEPKSSLHTFQLRWTKATEEEKKEIAKEQERLVEEGWKPITEARRMRAEQENRERIKVEEARQARKEKEAVACQEEQEAMNARLEKDLKKHQEEDEYMRDEEAKLKMVYEWQGARSSALELKTQEAASTANKPTGLRDELAMLEAGVTLSSLAPFCVGSEKTHLGLKLKEVVRPRARGRVSVSPPQSLASTQGTSESAMNAADTAAALASWTLTWELSNSRDVLMSGIIALIPGAWIVQTVRDPRAFCLMNSSTDQCLVGQCLDETTCKKIINTLTQVLVH